MDALALHGYLEEHQDRQHLADRNRPLHHCALQSKTSPRWCAAEHREDAHVLRAQVDRRADGCQRHRARVAVALGNLAAGDCQAFM